MPFLRIGSLDVDVQQNGAQADESITTGQTSRSFLGALRSTERVVARKWSFTTGILDEMGFKAFMALAVTGDFVACTGDAFYGETVVCLVRVTSAPYVPVGLGFMRVVSFTLEEVDTSLNTAGPDLPASVTLVEMP